MLHNEELLVYNTYEYNHDNEINGVHTEKKWIQNFSRRT
jgi:hypothetical protein